MLKKVNDLNPDEKILLPHAIANGEIDLEKHNENTLCTCGYKDYFLAIMIAAT